jgi:hypothetical protein
MIIYSFFNHPFFVIIGGIFTLISICFLIYAIYIVLSGVIPVWIRLGKGLSSRKIAIFADKQFDDLQDLLVDSKIISKKNIVKITKERIKKGCDCSLLLVHFDEFKENIDDILTFKKDNSALIIYAPQCDGQIEKPTLDRINSERNCIIVNFRGRLLNDILTSMITTSYD